MEDYSIILALNGKQIPVNINIYEAGEKTYFDINYDDTTITIYKDTLYTWTSDDAHGLSQADIQSIGEQVQQ